MLQIVEFEDGRYGVQNLWTGLILTNGNGKIRKFRTKWGATRLAYRRERKLAQTIRRLK